MLLKILIAEQQYLLVPAIYHFIQLCLGL